MALTTYGASTGALLTPSYAELPNSTIGTGFNMTAATLTNTTDALITFATNHTFKVGQQINITGVTGTTSYAFTNSPYVIKTVPAANQISVYMTASPTGSYTSGGTAVPHSLNHYQPGSAANSQTSGFLKYVNQKFFYGDSAGNLYYSDDGLTWTWVSITHAGTPAAASSQQAQVHGAWQDIDFDGTVYAICDGWGNVATSSDLSTWTTRVTGNGTSGFFGIKWCGGSYNSWVVVGGDRTMTGGGYAISTAPSGGVTWTTRTMTGTTQATLWSIDFDGNTTVVIAGYGRSVTPTTYGAVAISTSNSVFTHTTANFDNGSQWTGVIYNAAAGLWYFYYSFTNRASVIKTTAQLTTTAYSINNTVSNWSITRGTTFALGQPWCNGERPILESSSNTYYVPYTNGNLWIEDKYSATGTTYTDGVNAPTSSYRFPKTSSNAYSILGAASSTVPNPFTLWARGGGKWVIVQGATTGTASNTNTRVTVLQ
jgi:hypothetical protein